MENKSQRLLSLDALRGFDMMMIIGIDLIAGCLAALCGWPASAASSIRRSTARFTFRSTTPTAM